MDFITPTSPHRKIPTPVRQGAGEAGEAEEAGEDEGDKGTRGQGDKENNRCPMPNAPCPMPHAPSPMPPTSWLKFD